LFCIHHAPLLSTSVPSTAFKKSALEKFESKASSDAFNEKSFGSKLFSFLSSFSMWIISSID